MQKLKEILAQKKPKQKITIHKQVISQQKQQFSKAQQQAKLIRQQEEQRRLEQVALFYDKNRKKVITQVQQPVPPMPVELVKQGLRKLYQPVTLFGETAYKRYQRLLKIQKFHEDHPNQDMKLYDEEFIKQMKENQEYDELDAKYRQRMIQPKILNDPISRKKKENMINAQKDISMAQMCDQIYLWIIKVLKGWGEVLQQKYHGDVEKSERKKFNLLQQTNKQISSFFEVLKQRKGDKDMIQSIYHIMNCCLIREYVQANSRYIELSIGNAPWPMGVAMLGITVRRNAQRLSYVLDNQITRRWMQSIKRIITVSQELYPNQDKIKMAGYTVIKFT